MCFCLFGGEPVSGLQGHDLLLELLQTGAEVFYLLVGIDREPTDIGFIKAGMSGIEPGKLVTQICNGPSG